MSACMIKQTILRMVAAIDCTKDCPKGLLAASILTHVWKLRGT